MWEGSTFTKKGLEEAAGKWTSLEVLWVGDANLMGDDARSQNSLALQREREERKPGRRLS